MTKNERIVRQCAALFRISRQLVNMIEIIQWSLIFTAFIGLTGLALEKFGFVHMLGAIGLMVIAFAGILFGMSALGMVVVVLNIARADGDEEKKYDELIELARKYNKENGK